MAVSSQSPSIGSAGICKGGYGSHFLLYICAVKTSIVFYSAKVLLSQIEATSIMRFAVDGYLLLQNIVMKVPMRCCKHVVLQTRCFRGIIIYYLTGWEFFIRPVTKITQGFAINSVSSISAVL